MSEVGIVSGTDRKAMCDAILEKSTETPFGGIEQGLEELSWNHVTEALDLVVAAFTQQQEMANAVPIASAADHSQEEVQPRVKRLADGSSSEQLAAAVAAYHQVSDPETGGYLEAARGELTQRNEGIDEALATIRGIREALVPTRVEAAKQHLAAARASTATGDMHVLEFRAAQ